MTTAVVTAIMERRLIAQSFLSLSKCCFVLTGIDVDKLAWAFSVPVQPFENSLHRARHNTFNHSKTSYLH